MTPPVYITPEYLKATLGRALAEDVGAGDATSLATVPAAREASARFLAKDTGVLAGLAVAEEVFHLVDPGLKVRWSAADGDPAASGAVFGRVEGNARSILTAERLALNLVQRMSGIATLTARMVEAVQPYAAKILDTRKTAPGLRLLDKWAVRLGGGENHRIGLYDMILIKDNHIAAAGGVAEALRAAEAYRKAEAPNLKIEIEAATLEQVDEVMALGIADMILLDNMARTAPDETLDCRMLLEAVTRVRRRILTEASGNVTLANVGAIAATGVDAISCGFLTHSAAAFDASLKIELV